MKALATMIVACLALVLQGGFAGAHATSAHAHCAGMTVADTVSSDAVDSTFSTDWQNVTDGARSFSMSSAAGCAVVTFSGLASLAGSPNAYVYLYVRALLDGKACGSTGTDLFLAAVAPSPQSANSITRVCEHVAPGPHTVQVQYRSLTGDTVEISGHVLTVTHN